MRRQRRAPQVCTSALQVQYTYGRGTLQIRSCICPLITSSQRSCHSPDRPPSGRVLGCAPLDGPPSSAGYVDRFYCIDAVARLNLTSQEVHATGRSRRAKDLRRRAFDRDTYLLPSFKTKNEETSGLLVASEGGVVGRSGQGTEIDHKGLRFLVAIGVGQVPFSGRTPLFQLQSISYEGLFLFGRPGRGASHRPGWPHRHIRWWSRSVGLLLGVSGWGTDRRNGFTDVGERAIGLAIVIPGRGVPSVASTD